MASLIPPDMQAKVANWRQRANEGTLTLDEMKEAVKILRGGRVAAATAASSKKKKVAAPPADDLLNELEGL